MKKTLTDINKALGNGKKKDRTETYRAGVSAGDRHVYGTVAAINEDGTYEVSFDGGESSATCARLIGAKVGDVVLVTILANGYAVVTNAVGGDTDAADAQADIDAHKAHFWHDGDGAHIQSNENSYRTDLNGIGMALVELGDGERTIAEFGEITMLHGSNSSFQLDGNGIWLRDYNGEPIFYAQATANGNRKIESITGYSQSGDNYTCNTMSEFLNIASVKLRIRVISSRGPGITVLLNSSMYTYDRNTKTLRFTYNIPDGVMLLSIIVEGFVGLVMEVVAGRNAANTSHVLKIGNGADSSNLSNAFAVDVGGNGYFGGSVFVGCDEESNGTAPIDYIPISQTYNLTAGGYETVPFTRAQIETAMRNHGITNPEDYAVVGVAKVTTGHPNVVKISQWEIAYIGTCSVTLTSHGYSQQISTSTCSVNFIIAHKKLIATYI